jgi:hypothetical protein
LYDAPPGEDELHPGVMEGFRDGGANATAGAGDEGDLIGERRGLIHGHSLLSRGCGFQSRMSGMLWFGLFRG